jgi:hypothetical protein
MANDVTITFTADVSELQNGMQQATRAVETTSTALRGGADQINATFSSLSQAYANTAAQRISAAQTSSDAVLTMARQNEQAQSNIALNGVREQSSLIEGRAQMSELARQEELTGLLALEAQREAIERQHLQFLESTSQERTAAYAASQRGIEELTRQSVLNRLNIERDGTNEIYKSYLRTFEQAGNAVASSLMGMITGQMRLRDAARNILVQILQSFVQARVRMVADWLASVATQIAAHNRAKWPRQVPLLRELLRAPVLRPQHLTRLWLIRPEPFSKVSWHQQARLLRASLAFSRPSWALQPPARQPGHRRLCSVSGLALRHLQPVLGTCLKT